MSEPFLVYFADPMCSWCYGFGPELDALMRERPGLRVDVVMGGLRAYSTEAVTPEFRRSTAERWSHVARESGLPFGDAARANSASCGHRAQPATAGPARPQERADACARRGQGGNR